WESLGEGRSGAWREGFGCTGLPPVKNCEKLAVIPLAVCLWLAIGNSASAARLLTATIELNGQTVLQSTYPDNDYWGAPPAAAVWRYFGREPMSVEKAQIPADAADPLQAKFRGDLVIRILHVDRLIVEATATDLTLIRRSPASDKWFLPAEEVERLAQANGIPDEPSLALFDSSTAWLGLGIAAVVVI